MDFTFYTARIHSINLMLKNTWLMMNTKNIKLLSNVIEKSRTQSQKNTDDELFPAENIK